MCRRNAAAWRSASGARPAPASAWISTSWLRSRSGASAAARDAELDRVVQPSGRDQQLGALVDDGRPELGQRHRFRREGRHLDELVERGAAPGAEHPAQEVGGAARIVGGLRPCRRQIGADAVHVALAGLEEQPVAAVAPHQAVCARSEVPPQAGDLALQRVARRLGRFVAPDRVDEALRRQRVGSGDREEGEDGPPPGTGHGHVLSVHPDLERAEQVDLQPVPGHRPRAVRASGGSARCT